jgi:TetR/AcrR family transcriptional regulator, regulator of autoinduction and epiphytic fitness
MNSKTSSRRQGRPADGEVQGLEELIIETAKAHFFAHGYAGASVEKIASAAGIGKITIYRRYPTKEALFMAILQSVGKSILATPEAFDPHMANPLEELKSRCRILLELVCTEEAVATYGVLALEAKRFPVVVQGTVEAMFGPFEHRNLQLIARAVELGHIDPGVDPAGAYQSLCGLFAGWPLQNRLLAYPELNTLAERERFFETAWGIFARGIAPVKDATPFSSDKTA